MTDNAESEPLAPAPNGPTEELNPVEDMARTLRHVHSRYLTALLVLYCVAVGIGMGTVLLHPVRDWILFLGMFLVILAYLVTYIKAHQRGRRILRFFGMITTELLLFFWGFILADRIAPRKVFADGRVTERAEMSMLWAPVIIMGVVAVMLFVHWAWLGGRAQAAPADDPPALADA